MTANKQPHYHWKWAPTYFGGKNIDIFENRTHIVTCFSEDSAKRIISALKNKHSDFQSEQKGILKCDDKTCFATVLYELQELLHYINPDSPAGKIIARRYNEIWELRKQVQE